MGRDELAPIVVIEVSAPDEQTSDERRHHGLTHLAAAFVSEFAGE